MSAKYARPRWAVLTKMEWGRNQYRLNAYGNGSDFQDPIFPTRAEARRWASRQRLGPVRIVRCSVGYRA